MNDSTYFCIQSWMVTKLGLKGVERDVFAIIYGYSQDGESDFHGSLAYLAELTGYTKNSVCNALKSLVEKNLIIKHSQEVNNITLNSYTNNLDSIQKICIPIQKIWTNNNIDNKNNKNSNSKELLLENSEPKDFLGSNTKPKKKSSLYSKCIAVIDDYCLKYGLQLKPLLITYFNMMLEGQNIQYVNQWKGMLNKLTKLEGNKEEIIQQSIDRHYRSFFPVSTYKSNNVKNQPWEQDVSSSTYTEEELQHQEDWRKEMEAQGKRTVF